jgi:gliding motility-associated-like protein
MSGNVLAQCTTTINTFPYRESFETGTNNWVSGGTGNDWAWGTPSKTVITGAAAGTKCWISGGLTGSFYNYGERSWVESPCFDLTGLAKPYVSFFIFWDTERSYDGGNFQYSTDGGNTWGNVGTSNDPPLCSDQNWFNFASVTNLSGLVSNHQGWSGTVAASSGSCNGGGGSGAWKLATHCLSLIANQPSVKFRFTFGSGTTCNDFDGLAFDDFYVGTAPGATYDFSFACVNGNTIKFSDDGYACHDNWSWTFGDTPSSSNTSNTSVTQHQFSSGGTFDVTLQTGGGCTSDTTITKHMKLLQIQSAVTPVSCIGDSDGTANFTVANAGPGINYQWSGTNASGQLATGLPPGDYFVTITEPAACTTTEMVTIDYGPDAFASISIGNDTVVCPGSFVKLKAKGSFLSFHWQDNSTDSVYLVDRAGIYFVDAVNSSGCEATDTIEVKEDCINDIVIPNSFTPNGDGKNEIFNVDGSQTITYAIYIFDRWGELIFSSEDRMTGWDGTYKDKRVQEGIYNYLVNYSVKKGKDLVKKGSIYLFR